MLNVLDNVKEEPAHENPKKKVKRSNSPSLKDEIKLPVVPRVKSERCRTCKQYLDEVILYNGHPNNAVEELVTLTDERLQIFTGNETSLHQQDERPLHKILYFNVYDKEGHLCPFDTGLIEANKLLYFSGYVKAVYDEDTTTNNGIPTKDIGPINEWFIAGFDGGIKALVGFSTSYAEYYLSEAAPEYQPIMSRISKKIELSKLVIEFLTDVVWQNPTYEDLLQRLTATGDPEINEDFLITHSQFICDQVMSFDSAAASDEDLLITTPCMRQLVKMAGVTFRKQKTKKVSVSKHIAKPVSKWSKATTTNLVREVFETFFVDQIENKDDKGPRRKRCGICEACQRPDCGKCGYCRAMLKFGGAGRTKQACQKRRCPNMALEAADAESDAEEDEDLNVKQESSKTVPCSKRIIHKVQFVGESVNERGGRRYYKAAQVGEIMVELGDYVMLYSESPTEPLQIAKVGSMWEDTFNGSMFHAHLFCRGLDTILGESSDPRELFLVDICENYPLGSIVRKAEVEYRPVSSDWASNGGLDTLPPVLEDDGRTFFYSKRFDSEYSRFVEIVHESDANDSIPAISCSSCSRRSVKDRRERSIYEDGVVYWQDDVYKIGSGVFLEPRTFKFRTISTSDNIVQKENVDEKVYPEFYRKPTESSKLTEDDDSEPFCVGLIESVRETTFSKSTVIKITVRKFYRPENTREGAFLAYKKDLNLLYWSNEVLELNFDNVRGKCYITYAESLDVSPQEWSAQGPYRFYFTEAYDNLNEKFFEVPMKGYKIGQIWKGKGVGKGRSSSNTGKFDKDLPPQWPRIGRPLRSMDVFAGCGGLSEGLHQSGIAETKWAIELEPAAAQAFKLNNEDAIVYTQDCNELLRLVMADDDGEEQGGRKLPKKGDVELLVGGPPCQGFSGMNRFNAGQYSFFKNSLIVSYLSYCDYYRPRYFILENVRNFVSFKKSVVLKLTVRCLLAIGYQVTFGVLQAGHYGVPQTRRRLIIMAAAPGHVLPMYPDPQHVFSKKGCQLSIPVDNFKYYTGVKWYGPAPYRTITVRDAMSDLPDIPNGSNVPLMDYDSEPMSHFQRMVRKNHKLEQVGDHICKDMAPLVEGRMKHIPLYTGSDWRDLPNIIVKLRDGTYTTPLRYLHRTKKQNKGELPRGVCSCATGKPCDLTDRQFNTLIPWCLPHTADRHNNWAGLYGRLKWDGCFSTTVTNPEPMGKQGRVLHPEQHRVVSVRECARSQGFPDSYQFYGSILDKHRQVGNAVPPPLGLAIGRELIKALATTESDNFSN